MQRRSSRKKLLCVRLYNIVYYNRYEEYHYELWRPRWRWECKSSAQNGSNKSAGASTYNLSKANNQPFISLYTVFFFPIALCYIKAGLAGPGMDAFTMTICRRNQKYYYYILWLCINGFYRWVLQLGFEDFRMRVGGGEGSWRYKYVITTLTMKNTWNSGRRGSDASPWTIQPSLEMSPGFRWVDSFLGTVGSILKYKYWHDNGIIDFLSFSWGYGKLHTI